jgi:hypothetical protein
MSHKTYQLINPVIEGTFNDVVDSSKSPIKAAETFWERITSHVSGHVPKFMFSMRSVGDKSLHHFQVKEKISNGSYTIKELEGLKVTSGDVDAYHSEIDGVTEKEMGGGARKRYKKHNKDGRSRYPRSSSESSDSSDSDSDIYSGVEFNAKTTSPIAMFHYTTKFYHQDNGMIFEHQSTQNPNPIIVEPIPVVTVPIANVITSQHTFTSIPVFKAPLLPRIVIWH